MRAIGTLILSLLICCLFAFSPARAQIAIGISIDVAPPPLPVYDQPPISEPGYIWTPGYWAWDDDNGYYWVPGTWVEPPKPACCGRPVTGAGTMASMSFTRAIGARRSDSTAGSITGMVM